MLKYSRQNEKQRILKNLEEMNKNAKARLSVASHRRNLNAKTSYAKLIPTIPLMATK